jgi:hypothetical protein
MKDSKKTAARQSRRSFAKSAAAGLIAAPVVSAISNSTASASNFAFDSGDPPVIIDGGSLAIISGGSLDVDRESSSTFLTPTPENHVYGSIKQIRVVNDFSNDLLAPSDVGKAGSINISIWKDLVDKNNSHGDDDDDSDVTEYIPGNYNGPADVIITYGPGTGDTFKIEVKSTHLSDDHKKIFRRHGRNPKRYELNDWNGGNSKFRIGKVKITGSVNYETNNSDPGNANAPNTPDKGIRIILLMNPYGS